MEYFQNYGHDEAVNAYKFRRAYNSKGQRHSEILFLSSITKSVQFVPWFKDVEEAPHNLNCDDILEEWDEFLLNSFSDDFTYQTVY